MPVQLIHAVIHGFEKDQHSDVVKRVVVKDRLLDFEAESVLALVNGVASLLGRRKNAQSWGRFGGARREGLFREQFSRNAGVISDADNFLQITQTAMGELVVQASKKPTSTGGHMLFSFYLDEERTPHFLVAMIKQKGGIQLDDDYVPVGIVEIDMSKLHQAADIRVAEYLESIVEEAGLDPADNSPELKNYLSFLSQRDAGEASGYFISALGCEIGLSPSKATASIFEAVADFFDSKPALVPYKKRAKEALVEYLRGQHANDREAELGQVCHVLSALLEPQHVEHAEGMDAFFNGGKYKVPAEFFVHSDQLKKHTKISLESPEMNLKFNRGILGRTPDSRVYFNKDEKSLTIARLPEEMIKRLDAELEQ